jgi:hypothetical protein
MYLSGIDPTQISAGTASDMAVAQLGQLAFNTTPQGIKGYIYLKDSGSGITGDGYVVDIDGSAYTAVMSTVTTTAPGTGAGKAVAVARAAVTAGFFFWGQIYGPGTVRTNALCAAYTLINSTATPGQLDDDATAGAEVINGIVLDVATGGAAAVTAGWISWPNVGRTL